MVGNPPRSGKTIMLMRELIQAIKNLENTDTSNQSVMKAYADKLEDMSGGDIGVRWWIHENKLHCTIVYPNNTTRELLEW